MGQPMTRADGFEQALSTFKKTGTFDGQGLHIAAGEVALLMSAARERGDGEPILRADFRDATIEARFDGATFTGETHFDRATFTSEANFERVCFLGEAHFPHTTFKGKAVFNDAIFKKYAHFPDTTFKKGATFRKADLNEGIRLGPTRLTGCLTLEDASLGDVDLRVSCDKLLCKQTRFHGPAHLKVRRAEIWFDQAVFDCVSSLAYALSETSTAPINRDEMPRVRSFDGADIGNLTLADVDLTRCSFRSTLRLDSMRLAALCKFDESIGRMRIHEEQRWHASASGDERHNEAERLAIVYRALRKGREDAGSAPGAGDFYYGEMEMRRHGTAGFFEHAVIWLYWLVSGYGLRASRALVALALTVLVFAGLFTVFDIRGEGFADNFIFSLQGTTSLLRAPERLPTGGMFLEILLRLLGPLFVALAIISLRGRVKR
jgi:uncharacterized protein YjbI with pentapeptide repeats